MKKKLLLPILVFWFILCGANVAFADVYLMAKVSGNTPTEINPLGGPEVDEERVTAFLNAIFNSDYFKNNNPDIDPVREQIEYYAKFDIDEETLDRGNAYPDAELTLDYSNKTAGTWQTGDLISFYAVKANNNYSLYYVTPADDSGTWATEGLFNNNGKLQDMSHFAAWVWNSPGGESPVPEPATLFLMGVGLIGLAKFQRRKK
ncbi:MAG: PEP-CTERM sorting domain-containing protein [Desulfobacterales bacterium]|nr:PEP-CTERM sorting domain-containing protein [Desulfobacterales bacterium]